MTRRKKSIMQEAVENWPEDEAYGLLCDWRDMDSDETVRLADVKHMCAIFDREPDAEELKRRFVARLWLGL